MSTQMVYAFEAPDGTIVRAAAQGGELQLIRDGKSVAVIGHHQNNEASMSRDGLLCFDSLGACVADVTARRVPPRERKTRWEGGVVSPDGSWLMEYENGDYDHPQGLYALPVGAGKRKRLWSGDTTCPSIIHPFRKGGGKPGKRGKLDFPETALAPDGRTWALIETDRMELGRGSRRLCSVAWKEGSLLFYPKKYAWDLARSRILLSGMAGVTSIRFDGTVTAFSKLSAVSNVALWRNEVVVAITDARYGTEGGKMQVRRLHPETLGSLGPLAGLPEREERELACALLPLRDGSLAWIPRNRPIWILPGPGVERASTPLVRVMGGEAVTTVPHAAEPWYSRAIGTTGKLADLGSATPGARRSLARYFLEELHDDGRFRQLAFFDPEAFRPWHPFLIEWDDERLSRLERACWRTWWWIAKGMRDEHVDRLATRIRTAKETELRRHLTGLLLGADTDRALEALASLGRARKDVRELCHTFHVHVPKQGPAERRYHPELRVLVVAKGKGKAAVDSLIPAEQVLAKAHGVLCEQAPNVLANVALSLVGLRSKARTQPFLLTSCDACDEWSHPYDWKGAKAITLVGTRPQRRCEGSGLPALRPQTLAVRAPAASDQGLAGTIGGRPRWTQSAEVPCCGECGKLMFYVGTIHGSRVTDQVTDTDLFGFHCEDCGIGAQIPQFT